MPVFLIKGMLHLLALLSLPRVHALATWLGKLIFPQKRLRITQVTRTNIQLCFPQLSSVEQDKLIKQSLIEACKTVTELGAIWLWPYPRVLKQIRAVTNEIYLQQAIQTGQGVILLTPHLGAWEMAGLYVSAHYPLTALYRPPKLSGLDNFIQQARERAGGCFVPTNQKGIRTVYQALHRGQVVGILPDQVPHETTAGIFSPFFGVPAYTMVLVFRLVQKTGALVLFTYAERLSRGEGFHLHFRPAPPLINSAQVEISVRALNQGIEQCIQTGPSQYQWNYKRFKRHPVGEQSKSYYDG